MANTSCKDRADELLAAMLAGQPWNREALARLVREDCSEALLRIVVEGLADRFEPALCDTYAEMFAHAIACAAPGVNPEALYERYRRVRRVRRFEGAEPARVFVLSRVTLGADVAVTSVLLDAARRRFPGAELIFVGPRKNAELFAVPHAEIHYRRGSLQDRLACWEELRELLAAPDGIVIDPDSRLTQLGLLPVCPEDRYYFFESRAYGGDGEDPLPVLTSRWAEEVFSVPGRPFVSIEPVRAADITVSLGVGENPAKRIADPFENELLRLLAGTGASILVDRGAGGEEAERVARAIAGTHAATWDGSFAGFASRIAGSHLYVGYDSAGQHVAAACGVPLVSIFAGFPCPRMFARWRPAGTVIRVDNAPPSAVLARVVTALQQFRGQAL